METKNAPTEARKLNMDEKRRLEKILFADIQQSSAQYSTKRSAAYSEHSERILKGSKMKALLDGYIAARKKMRNQEKVIEQLGLGIYNGDIPSLYIRESHKIPELRDFNDETAKTKSALEALKRTYTLKLFAGGEEAKELFASLTRELATIVNLKN
jgi:hypothetical protein